MSPTNQAHASYAREIYDNHRQLKLLKGSLILYGDGWHTLGIVLREILSCIQTLLYFCSAEAPFRPAMSPPSTMSANNFWAHTQPRSLATSKTSIKSDSITIKREAPSDPVVISPVRAPVTPPQMEKPKFVRPWEMSPMKQRTAPISTTPSCVPMLPMMWSSTPYNMHMYPWLESPSYGPSPMPYGLLGAYGQVMSPSYLGSPRGRSHLSVTPSDDGVFQSFGDSSGGSAVASPKEKDLQGKGCRKHLSPRAIQLMEEWYRLNFNHPYPTNETIEYFALEGSISVVQVKKWMANKRVRSFNTLSFNGSIHPKRLKRLQRMSLMRTTTPRHVTQRDPIATLESYTALQLLNQWYQEHSDCPYPSESEKEDLAKRCGIQVSHLTLWLENRRNSTPSPRQSSTVCGYDDESMFRDKVRVRNVSCRLDFQQTETLVHQYCH